MREFYLVIGIVSCCTIILSYRLLLQLPIHHHHHDAPTTCNVQIKSSKIDFDWNCQTLVNIEPNYTVSSFPVPAPLLASTRNGVIYLFQTMGQLCNQLGIFGAALFHIKRTQQTGRFLAFAEEFSEVAWALDLKALSHSVPGLLLDCAACNGGNIRCLHMYHKGLVYDVSKHVFPTSLVLNGAQLFYTQRPDLLGYMEEFNTLIQPKRHLKQIVHQLMQNYRRRLPKDTAIVAIHRRYMDYTCYFHLGIHGAFSCYPKAEYFPATERLRAHPVFSRLNQINGWDTVMRDDERDTLEREFHHVMGCNYTLNSVQEEILRQTWPALFHQPFAVILATDKQAPAGDQALKNSPLPVEVTELARMERPTCFERKRNHFLLAEMIAQSLADFHMENVVSSCGNIVAIWRAGKGWPRSSSWPPMCYDAYYDRVQKKDVSFEDRDWGVYP